MSAAIAETIWLSQAEVAEILGVSPRSVREIVARGELRQHRLVISGRGLGGRVRYDRDDVTSYVRRCLEKR